MSEWPIVPLGEVIHHRTEFIQIDDFSQYKRCRVQLHARGIVLRDQVPGIEIKTKKQQVCRADELLVAEIDAKHGGYGIVPQDLEGALVSSHYFLFEIDNTRLDRRFLGYYIRTPGFFEQVSAQGSTNYAAIRPRHVLNYTVPLPPLSVQQRIVEWIDAVATRAEEAMSLRKDAEACAQSLLRSSINKVFDELLSSDDNWELVPLLDVATIERGKFGFRPRNDPRFYGGTYPFIQIGDISNSDRYIRQFSQSLNDQGLKVSRMFSKGTVVIAITGATIGATGILTFDSCFPDSIVGINSASEDIPPEYLYWALEFAKSQALAQATQTTQPNINLRILNTLQIPMSSAENLKQAVRLLDGLFTSLRSTLNMHTESAKEIDALIPSVLSQVFNREGHLG